MKIKLLNAPRYKEAIDAAIESEGLQRNTYNAGMALERILLGRVPCDIDLKHSLTESTREYLDSRYDDLFQAVSDSRYDLNIYSIQAWMHLMPLDALDDLARFLCGEEFTEGD